MLDLSPNGTFFLIAPTETGAQTPILSPYSARGLTQTMEPITGNNQWIRRDVNGTLRSLADVRFRKYKSTITCRDGDAPCLDNSWIGTEVGVYCAFEFSYPTGGTPARTPVPGSTRDQNGIIFYRPALIMLITAIRNSFPEYQGINDWQLDLEEV